MPSDLEYWVWLATQQGINNTCRRAILKKFGNSAEDAFEAAPAALEQVAGITDRQLRALEGRSLHTATEIMEKCAKEGYLVLPLYDRRYPQRLRNISNPPLLLFARGRKLPQFDEEVAVALVGTRKCTPYGVRMAEYFGYEISRQGGLVVSGLAKGIDKAAIEGALRAECPVAAVIGSGVDVAYPPECEELYEAIEQSGVILSEYPPGSRPYAWHFPARNRILSGLSLATVVVEAPEKSGAIITAAMAREQGRDVFAVPHPLDSENGSGCTRLIREGNRIATRGWDILQVYRSRYPHKLHPETEHMPLSGEGEKAEKPPLPEEAPQEVPQETQDTPTDLPPLYVGQDGAELPEDQLTVLKLLDDRKPMLIDEMAVQADVPVQRVIAALTMLEIEGYIRRDGTSRYVRTVQVVETKEK